MATIVVKGNNVSTVGDLPTVGSQAPQSSLTGTDLSTLDAETYAGRRIVLNIFPSIDTPTCATSVRTFNKLAADLENTTVVCASADLPFAAQRFCAAEGIDNVVTGSSFRSDFGQAFGVTMAEGPLEGLLARSVVVIDVDGTVLHSQIVPELSSEPDYDAALAALA